MVLGGALERAGFDGAGRKFTIKGGVALEMRLRHLARATKDLDLVLLSEGDLIQELASALERPYEGFSFRLRGEPHVMPNRAVRAEVALQYLGKSWGTIQVDITRQEGGRTEVDMVDAISLAPFGLGGPETLPCLSLPYHVAQKIHAMTAPPPEGRRNDRFRDLVDLLLMREWITDFEVVQRACREVFEARGTHAWPPFFTPPDHWIEQFATMAVEMVLPIIDLHQAAIEIRQFIVKIDSAAEWISTLPSLRDLTATTWYFAVGADESLHRVPVRIGEGFFTGDYPDAAEIPAHWQREPGGVALIGVVLFLRNRKPVYVEGVSAKGFALNSGIAGAPVEFDPSVWSELASELLRQARVPVRALHALSVFLSKVQCNLPCVLADAMDVTTAQAHWYCVNWNWEWFLWDLQNSEPIKGSRG
jgi:hypothetical protein